MRTLLIPIVLVLAINASAQGTSPTNAEGMEPRPHIVKEASPASRGTGLTHRIIDAPNGTFGYEVLVDGKLLVHQATIPGQPGNTGCRTKEQAEALAVLVESKVRTGQMPPTVRKEELDSLTITH